MLTLSLKDLEARGLVKRPIFPTVPPRVDYELTPLGQTLVDPLRAMKEWARDHRDELIAARAAYAQSSTSAPNSATPTASPTNTNSAISPRNPL